MVSILVFKANKKKVEAINYLEASYNKIIRLTMSSSIELLKVKSSLNFASVILCLRKRIQKSSYNYYYCCCSI
ncbi:hypothetical protein BLOT_015327 [Blomia tropicalis]|nr:hypothetical protein BLOT_015327 [Blomia tropicalis]